MLLPFYKLTGDALEMSAINEKEFFITFDHTVPCNKGSCERLTDWGHAVYWNDGKELMLFPFCWEHGFALRDFVVTAEQLTAEQTKEQYASVERFVVGYHNGVGTATVLSPYDPEAVLGFMPYKPETLDVDENWYVPDYAWYVRYEFEGTRRYGYAVFSEADWCFKWYEVEEDLLWASFSRLLS
jgi:hypothetical protein